MLGLAGPLSALGKLQGSAGWQSRYPSLGSGSSPHSPSDISINLFQSASLRSTIHSERMECVHFLPASEKRKTNVAPTFENEKFGEVL